jgi:pimeloyl-ACP methyl ester carboxylesterase
MVLCLHAGNANSGQWRALMERLASRFRVIACDLSGSGKSPPFPPGATYTLDEEVSFLAPAFEAAGDAFHLVGHSYGGAVALKAALRYRARLRSLTLFEPVLFSLLLSSAPQSDAVREIRALAQRTTELAACGDLEGAAREFVDYWFEPGTWTAMREETRAPIREGMSPSGQRWGALFNDPARLADLARLDVLTLLINAQKSRLPARELSRLLAATLPRVWSTDIPGVGHMAPLRHPELVNPVIETFLLENEREAGAAPVRQGFACSRLK